MDTTSAANTAALPGLRQQAIRLEQFSLAWMLTASWPRSPTGLSCPVDGVISCGTCCSPCARCQT
jgi:hypothetical protein